MKKLSEYRDEDALDLLADLIEPAETIFSDKDVQSANSKSMWKAVKVAIKKHKKEVMEIMAILDGAPVEDLHINVLSLPIKVMEVISDKDLVNFFVSQGQNMESTSSGSVTENTSEEA